jgi:hypothetical protein
MSLAITKTNFEQLIDDRDNGVIALSGKWGSGKSYMWRQVQKDSTNDAIKDALYVSLFGVKDILQLKLKIVQSAVPDSKTGHVAREVMTSAWRQASKFLKTVHPGFAALDEIALLAVPAILRNRVIVIDDIERKHAALSIEEAMGFIDEFTQVYGSRILLILNSDQLDDKAMWDKLREKVIDHEIALDTTPAEAFGIAIVSEPSPYASHIQGAVETCKISNIRIIQKIIRSVNRLLGGRSDLDDEVLQRAVPSTVLMCAIHYRGLEDGPSVDFVLNFNSMLHAMEERQRPPNATDEEVAKEKRWAELLESLSINSCDEYEHMVVAFLKSGLRIDAEVKAILDRYVAEKDAFGAEKRSRRFHDLTMWHPLITDAELLAEATAVAQVANMLDGYTVSSLHETISELPGGAPIADAMLVDWLRAFNAMERAEFRHDSIFDRPLHPEIKAAFVAMELRLHPTPSLVDACLQIASDSWGDGERASLRAATPESYEQAIKSLAGENLRKFMRENIDLYARRAEYETDFGDAMENFAKACRAICNEDESSRLSRLIRLLFVHAKVASVLDVHDWPRPLEEEAAAAAHPVA